MLWNSFARPLNLYNNWPQHTVLQRHRNRHNFNIHGIGTPQFSEIRHTLSTPTWDISLSLKKIHNSTRAIFNIYEKNRITPRKYFSYNLRDLRENRGQKRPLGQKVRIWSNEKNFNLSIFQN